MEESRLRAAVIGVGTMGSNHARIYNELDNVELVAVADGVHEQAERVGRRFRVATYTDYEQMLVEQRPDLVTIAVPTARHYEVAYTTISAGVATLIEKPITRTVEEGERLVTLAEERGVPLTVGYLERFNPAIQMLKKEIDQQTLGRIYQVRSRRISPLPIRIQDVGVAIDLATHDLDMIQHLIAAPVHHMHVELGRFVHATHEDMLAALIRFENGIIGMLDVSWLVPTKVREFAIIGEAGMFVVNYLTQDLIFYENAGRGGAWPELAIFGVSEGKVIHYPIGRVEPLRAQLSAFVEAVRTGGAPLVSGRDALGSLALAQQALACGMSAV